MFGACLAQLDEEDRQFAQNNEQMQMMRLHRKLKLKGKVTQGVRASISLCQETGVHNWDLYWNHEPANLGRSDAVGLCSDANESFGPMQV